MIIAPCSWRYNLPESRRHCRSWSYTGWLSYKFRSPNLCSPPGGSYRHAAKARQGGLWVACVASVSIPCAKTLLFLFCSRSSFPALTRAETQAYETDQVSWRNQLSKPKVIRGIRDQSKRKNKRYKLPQLKALITLNNLFYFCFLQIDKLSRFVQAMGGKKYCFLWFS